VLCSEIIAWSHPEIRENKSGSTSFFDEEEIGEESDRYKLMADHLGSQGDDLPVLLERAWFSSDFAECPTIVEWRDAIRKVQAKNSLEDSPYVEDQSNIATIMIRKRSVQNRTPVETALEPEPLPVEEDEPQAAILAQSENEDEDAVIADMQEQASPETEYQPQVEEQFQPEAVVLEQSARRGHGQGHLGQGPAPPEPAAQAHRLDRHPQGHLRVLLAPDLRVNRPEPSGRARIAHLPGGR